MPLLSFISGNVKQVAYTSAIAGLAGYAGSKMWLGLGGTLNLYGRSVDTNLGIGLVVAGSAFLGELGSTYVLPMIPRFNLIAGFESDIIAPGLTGLAAYQTLNMFAGSGDLAAVGGQNVIILGFASHLLARKASMTLRQLI